MSNTSATGGYLSPAPLAPLPGALTLRQFLQQIFVGISGLDGEFVRPKWQKKPPQQPDIDVNWIAFALVVNNADTNAYVGVNPDGSNLFQRCEGLEIQCSFYGADSAEIAALVRDGFQIPQNLEALRSARMGFVNTNQMTHVPDLVNESWVDRYEMSVFLNREILRSYPVLTFQRMTGSIKSVIGASVKTLALDSNNKEG